MKYSTIFFKSIFTLILLAVILPSCRNNSEKLLTQKDWVGNEDGGFEGNALVCNYRFYEDGTYTKLITDNSTGRTIVPDHTHEQAKQKGDVKRYYVTNKVVKIKTQGNYNSDYRSGYENVSTKPLLVVMDDSTRDSNGQWMENPFLYFTDDGNAFGFGNLGYISKSCKECEIGGDKSCPGVLCIIRQTPFLPE
jgi:hypothetical protein